MTQGSWIYSRTHRAPGQVIDVDELWGQTRYRVWLPALNTVLLHRPEELDVLGDNGDSHIDSRAVVKAKFAVVAGKVLDLLNDDKLLAPIDAAVIPLPHQIRALRRVASNPGKVRYLLADEVGLGKTIEAGLAIRELKLRGLVERVLVVAPKGLIPQWIVEMRERFGEEFRHFDPGQFAAVRKITGGENVWKSYDQVICSMDGVKPLDTRKGWDQERIDAFNRDRILDLAGAGWDLIVVDEAHRVGGSSETVARHAMARMLAEAAPYLLLLSATPHQGKTDAFQRLMSLLDAEAFPDEDSVNRDRVAPYVVRTEKRQSINHDGSPLFKPRITKLVKISWEGHDAQQQLYDAVTAYVRESYNQAKKEKKTHVGFLMVLMQRLISSSTRAIAATLERRLAVLEEPPTGQLELFPDEDVWSEMDGQAQLDMVLREQVAALDNEKDEVRLLLDAARKVQAQGPDAKAKALLEWVYRMQEEEEDPELKVLIFTEFVPTQAMLAEFLESRGMSVVCLNGGLSLEERKTVQRRFSEDVRIMISTDAGGEGLNLQFCHVIINFDLGWRPMALEQRIGRLDRIGQKHVVKALNFLLEDSVEYRIQEVIETKLQTIFEEFGVDKTSDLLDSVEGNRMFDRLFVEALTNPDGISSEAEQLTEHLRHDAQEERQSRVLEGEAAPDSSELSAVSGQPLSDLLEMMVRFHVEAGDGSFTPQEEGAALVRWPDSEAENRIVFPGTRDGADGELITLDHSKIRGLLGRTPVHGKGEPVPCLVAEDLPKSVDGIWSLWVLRLSSFDFNRARVFPVYVDREGQAFAQTARHVWDRFAGVDLAARGFLDGQEGLDAFELVHAAACEEGRSYWDQMERDHLRRWESERARAQHHFASRRRMVERVGLAEVRGYRLRQLEADESQRMSELEAQKTLLPDIEPLVILSLHSS